MYRLRSNRLMMLLLLVLTALLVVPLGTAVAEGPNGTVTGTVSLYGQPLADVEVFLFDGDPNHTCTAADGSYTFENVNSEVDITLATGPAVSDAGCSNVAFVDAGGRQLVTLFAPPFQVPDAGTSTVNLDVVREVGRFIDDDGSIFEPDIEWVADAGITLGCSALQYCPDNPVTRGQMAAFLNRALELPAGGTTPFTDIAGSPFAADIAAVFAAEITQGCSATAYCPDNPVTRGQMAAFLHRALD